MRTLILFLLLLTGTQARADATVNLCSHATQAGAGVNLTTAIIRGGTITFDCPIGARIRFDAPVAVARSVQVDGGSRVTLYGAGASGLFRASGAVDLTLRRITLMNASAQGGTLLDPASAVDGFRTIRVVDTTVRNTRKAFRTRPTGRIELERVSAQGNEIALATATHLHAESLDVSGHSGRVFDTFEPGVGGLGQISLHRVAISGGSGSRFRNCTRLHVSDSSFRNGKARYFRGDAVPLIRLFDLVGAVESSCVSNTFAYSSFSNNEGTHAAIWLHSDVESASFRNVQLTANRGRFGALSLHGAQGKAPSVELRNVQFNGNDAWLGAAVHSIRGFRPRIQGVNVTLHQNRSDGGSAGVQLPGGEVLFVGLLATDNKSERGAGVADLDGGAGDGSLTLANSLVARNTSAGSFAVKVPSVSLLHSTLADNAGGGVQATRRLELTATVVANNDGGNCRVSDNTVVAAADSFQFPQSDCGSMVSRADPMLDGAYMPLPESPLYSAADVKPCTNELVRGRDLVGEKRPRFGDRCTAGAIEGELSRWLVRHRRDEIGRVLAECLGSGKCVVGSVRNGVVD